MCLSFMSDSPYPLSSRLWVVSLTETLARRGDQLRADWPQRDREAVGDQWSRAIDSVGLNLSEGYARIHPKERLHFYSYASASVDEAIYCLRRARDKGLISPREAWSCFHLLIR